MPADATARALVVIHGGIARAPFAGVFERLTRPLAKDVVDERCDNVGDLLQPWWVPLENPSHQETDDSGMWGGGPPTYRRRPDLFPGIPIPAPILRGAARILPLEHLIMIIPARMRRAHFSSGEEPFVTLKGVRFGEQLVVERACEWMRNGGGVEADGGEVGISDRLAGRRDLRGQVEGFFGRAAGRRSTVLRRRESGEKVFLLRRMRLGSASFRRASRHLQLPLAL